MVEVEGVSACQRCARGQGCGAGIFNQGISPTQIACFTREPVAANQTVDIEIEEASSSWLWLVAGAYGLPLLGLLLASLITTWAMPTIGTSKPLALADTRPAQEEIEPAAIIVIKELIQTLEPGRAPLNTKDQPPVGTTMAEWKLQAAHKNQSLPSLASLLPLKNLPEARRLS